MRSTGIIMECNPFHEGHRYIIEKAGEIAEGGPVIVLMSGDFVQRGIPAVVPKEIRVREILDAGADLVLELPVRFATASAERFAAGAVSILAGTGIVTDLIFGSETGDLSRLTEDALFLVNEPEDYRVLLRQHAAEGMPFPSARSAAAAECNAHVTLPDSPNDLLGEEYLKSLIRLDLLSDHRSAEPASSGIIPHAIQRIPGKTASLLRREMAASGNGVSPDDFSLLLLDRLLFLQSPEAGSDTRKEIGHITSRLDCYEGVTTDLANRILHMLPHFLSWTQFCSLLKTRNITYTAISRAMLHILLNITKESCAYDPMDRMNRTGANVSSSAQHNEYVRLLGARRSSLSLPGSFRQTVISSHADYRRAVRAGLSYEAQRYFLQDISASELYDHVVNMKKKTEEPISPVSEFSKPIILI